jgi:hypothetical protein
VKSEDTAPARRHDVTQETAVTFYKRLQHKSCCAATPARDRIKDHQSLALCQIASPTTHALLVPLTALKMSNYQQAVVPLTVAPIAPPGVTGLPQANTNTNPTPAAQTNGPPQSFAQDHWTRYHHLKGVEGAKNALIEDVLSRYDAVMLQCQNLINEQNAQTARSNASAHDSALLGQQAEYIRYLENLMNGNPFVVVIVDGNNFLFNDAFIRDGEIGGRAAAVVFKDELTEWVFKSIEDPPNGFKILIQVYADLKGLAGTFVRGGVIENMSTFGEFVRGFNTLFELVDIGGGNVDSRITGRPRVISCYLHHLQLCANVFQITLSFTSTITTAAKSSLAVLRSFWTRMLGRKTCSRDVWRCSKAFPRM